MIFINGENKDRFIEYLRSRQFSEGTINRYIYHLQLLAAYAENCIRDISHFLGFRGFVENKNFCAGTVNGIYTSVNKFMEFLKVDWRLIGDKVQRDAFLPPDKVLTMDEYQAMLRKAEEIKNKRLSLMVQTLAGTGIRVSELRYITVESLSPERAVITNKGKVRQIILPKDLVKKLKLYCHEHGITSGPVFVTRTGKPLDRSNIWKMLKRLARLAGVTLKKVFPHNLRHLFARTFNERYHDMSSLANILGHSSINTTRVYTADSGQKEQKMMNSLGLILTD